MKTTSILILSLIVFVLPAFASGEHHHSEKIKAGPNGGRVIHEVNPQLEFFVTPERKVRITALTADLEPAKMSGQIISITAGERSNPTKMELKEEEGSIVSTSALPAGSSVPVSISIKANASSKAVYERFNLNMAKCSECKLPEYACICGH